MLRRLAEVQRALDERESASAASSETVEYFTVERSTVECIAVSGDDPDSDFSECRLESQLEPVSVADITSSSQIDVLAAIGPVDVEQEYATVERFMVEDSTEERSTVAYWSSSELPGVKLERNRIHRIRYAQDALNPYEEKLFDILWGLPKKPAGGETSRVCRKGYADLERESKLCKRALLGIITRLIEKGFLELIAQYDKRQPKAYRVFCYTTVLEYQKRNGLEWFVKVGRGISYAARIVESSTVEHFTMSQRSTVAPGEHSTVEPGATPIRHYKEAVLTPPLSSSIDREIVQLRGVFDRLMLPFDDDAGRQIIEGCRKHQPASEIDEISTAVRIRWEFQGKQINPANPVGWLITHVPSYLEGSGLEALRQMLGKGKEG